MPNNSEKAPLTLRILTPQGPAAELDCESITLPMAEDSHGRGSGSLGIRKGHESCVIALTAGTVTARSGGNVLLRVHISGGFGSVKSDLVLVIAPEANKE